MAALPLLVYSEDPDQLMNAGSMCVGRMNLSAFI